ncbi:MAG: translation initiation factor IF-2, partial [Alphaproteobacteria bacterium]
MLGSQEEPMSEEKKLTLSKRGTLGLGGKGRETGQVRQSFSHGRSKPVVVERRRKRVVKKTGEAPAPETAPTPGATPPAGEEKAAAPDAGREKAASAAAQQGAQTAESHLTAAELEVRKRALEQLEIERKRIEEEKRRAEEEARKRE